MPIVEGQIALDLDFAPDLVVAVPMEPVAPVVAVTPILVAAVPVEPVPVARVLVPQSWDERPPVGFDLETTGPEPLEARIVQAAIIDSGPGGLVHEWLVDPGVEIPAGASAVHGISTERARAEGRPASQAVGQIADVLAAYWAEGRAVVIYNAQYDLTVINTELVRHGRAPLAIGCVVDPLVIWREAERYRKGKKRLSDAAERFAVAPGDAHDATSDARAAIGVGVAVCALADLDGRPPEELMALQEQWHRSWATNFADWLSERGDDASGVNLHWPVRPA